MHKYKKGDFVKIISKDLVGIIEEVDESDTLVFCIRTPFMLHEANEEDLELLERG